LREAGIYELPEKLAKYFKCSEVSEVEENGCVEIAYCSTFKSNIKGIEIYNEHMREGFTIRLKDLPEGVDIIRVYNAY